jgi:hypothetical protein
MTACPICLRITWEERDGGYFCKGCGFQDVNRLDETNEIEAHEVSKIGGKTISRKIGGKTAKKGLHAQTRQHGDGEEDWTCTRYFQAYQIVLGSYASTIGNKIKLGDRLEEMVKQVWFAFLKEWLEVVARYCHKENMSSTTKRQHSEANISLESFILSAGRISHENQYVGVGKKRPEKKVHKIQNSSL